MHIKTPIIISSLVIGLFLAILLGLLPLFFQDQSPSLTSSLPIPPLTSTPIPIPTSPSIPPLTLETVMENNYRHDRNLLSQLSQNDVVQIVAAGDVMLGREVGINLTRQQDFNYPFQLVAPLFQPADLAMVNLENPVIKDCPLNPEGMIFCSTPGTLTGLQFTGIDVVNLANNHTLNHGAQGLKETVQYLDHSDIKYAGLNDDYALFEIRGTKIAVLGFTAFGGGGVLSEWDRSNVETLIAKASKVSDLQMVNFHWGNEYQSQPSVGQRLLAYAAIDAGADAIIAHHPHWVQGMELYNQKPIFYSLGNLVFDQMWSTETREGLIVELNFYQSQVAAIYLFPTFMENIAQPNLMPVGRGNTILSKFENLSRSLQDSQAQTLELYQPTTN